MYRRSFELNRAVGKCPEPIYTYQRAPILVSTQVVIFHWEQNRTSFILSFDVKISSKTRTCLFLNCLFQFFLMSYVCNIHYRKGRNQLFMGIALFVICIEHIDINRTDKDDHSLFF